jgi:hypothetical protein
VLHEKILIGVSSFLHLHASKWNHNEEGAPMRKWSLLSIPLVGFASVAVWAQAIIGAPLEQYSGVVVREPVPRGSVLSIDGITKRPGVVPLGTPTEGPRGSSPSLKSAPVNPATSSPDLLDAPEQAETAPPGGPAILSSQQPDAGVAAGQGLGNVERVEPTQITSPAVAATDDSASEVELDNKGALSGSGRGRGTDSGGDDDG